jgi:general secretion pathway protein C
VAPSRPSRPAEGIVADADTDGGEVGRGGSFDASGQSGDGTASRTKSKKPCEDRPGIWSIQDGHWGIQRSVVDYYAGHFPELDRQVGSEPASGADGRPIGLKIVLSRCSILKEAGLRSGDIIHSANGLKVHSYAQALAAWLRLRNSSRIKMEVTRKGQPLLLEYKVEG